MRDGRELEQQTFDGDARDIVGRRDFFMDARTDCACRAAIENRRPRKVLAIGGEHQQPRLDRTETVAVQRAGGMDQHVAGAAIARAEVGAFAVGTGDDDADVGVIVLVRGDVLRWAIDMLGREHSVVAPLEERGAEVSVHGS